MCRRSLASLIFWTVNCEQGSHSSLLEQNFGIYFYACLIVYDIIWYFVRWCNIIIMFCFKFLSTDQLVMTFTLSQRLLSVILVGVEGFLILIKVNLSIEMWCKNFAILCFSYCKIKLENPTSYTDSYNVTYIPLSFNIFSMVL